MMEDHTGRLWYGTESDGVFFSDPDGKWQRLKSRNQISQGHISCLFEDGQENIWVGTDGDGLYRITLQPVTMLKLPPPMDNVDVTTICLARDGAVWIGTAGAGIVRWAKEGHLTMFGEAQGLNKLLVKTIFEDSRTNLWVGTSGGLFKLEGERFAQVIGPPAVSSMWIRVLFEDRGRRLWIGSIGGLVCLQSGQFKVYPLRMDQNDCDIRSIAEDATGDLWIGTMGQGLFRLPHNRPDKLHRVTGYPAKDAKALFFDRDRTLWVGSWGEGLFMMRVEWNIQSPCHRGRLAR